MATSLIATPLPDQAAIRLYLESSADAPLVMTEFTDSLSAREIERAQWSAVGDSISVSSTRYNDRHVVYFVANPDITIGSEYASRAITGLVIGQTYRVSLAAQVQQNGPWTISVDGVGAKTLYPSPSPSTLDYTLDGKVVYEFVATATTHNLRLAPLATGEIHFFYFSALRIERVTNALIEFETDFPSTEDTNWSVAGTPAGASSANAIVNGMGDLSTSVGVRAFGRQWSQNTGTPNVQNASLRRTLTGLTIGVTYTVRAAVFSAGVVNGLAAPFKTTLGVVGIGANTPTAWSSWRWVNYTFTATATSHQVAVTIAEPVTLQGGDLAFFVMDYLRLDEVPLVSSRTLASLTRSDSNGTGPVRLFEDQDLLEGTLIVSDYEAALNGFVSYTAVVDIPGGSQETATALVENMGALLPVIAPATMPQYRQTVPLITGYESQRQSATTVHEVVGRADPLVVLGPLRTRQGQLEMFATDYTAARALVAVYDRGEVVLLRQPDFPGLDMYHVSIATRIAPDVNRWRVSVDYVETKNPVGPLLGSLGWTFDQAATSYSTFASARAAFPTFNDYTLGPVG